MGAKKNDKNKKEGNNPEINPHNNLIFDKPIVYISSNLEGSNIETSSFDFFVHIVNILSKESYSHNFDLIVKVPTNSTPLQQDIIDRISIGIDKYYGIILAPNETNKLIKPIRELLKKINAADIHSFPIITIDKYFHHRINKKVIPYVSSDWERGGELAAEHFYKFFGNKNTIIQILKGKEGSIPRIQGFQKKILQINTTYFGNQCNSHDLKCDIRCLENCPYKIVISEELDFSRESARRYVEDKITEICEKYMINGIFSCNDEMALGARDALMKITKKNLKYKDIRIVGFDGINEVMKILDEDNEDFLIGTIDVKIREQVKATINYLINKPINKDSKYLVPCVLKPKKNLIYHE